MFQQQLQYDESKWVELPAKEVNTLQMFITNRCNMRCPECFNLRNLGREEMSLENYQTTVMKYGDLIDKVILVGGEPTLHSRIRDIVRFNHSMGKRTTIYTNGARLGALKDVPIEGLSVRVSVFGLEDGWKALRKLRPYDHLSPMFTYMLKRDNINEFLETAYVLENEYHCQALLISTCRGEDYWTEYDYTLPLSNYAEVLNEFLASYNGNMTLHIATRGVIRGRKENGRSTKCRFGNVFIGKMIQCPFDIAKDITTDEISFGTKPCDKHETCVLSKIVLKRKPADIAGLSI